MRQGIIRVRAIELHQPSPRSEGKLVTGSIEHAEAPKWALALRAVLALPDIEPEAVDELEEAIRSARLPVRDQDLFGVEQRRGRKLLDMSPSSRLTPPRTYTVRT